MKRLNRHQTQIINSLLKDISVINLEAALSGFAGGFTSQQTIITLARHNAVFAYIIEEHFKIKVNLLSVNTNSCSPVKATH